MRMNKEQLLQIAEALECTSTPGGKCDTACPYLIKEQLDKEYWQKLPPAKDAGMAPDNLTYCDVDRVALDAARILREAAGGIE